MQEFWGLNPTLGGLWVNPFQISARISTLQSKASGLQSTMQGIPAGPKRLLRIKQTHIQCMCALVHRCIRASVHRCMSVLVQPYIPESVYLCKCILFPGSTDPGMHAHVHMCTHIPVPVNVYVYRGM